MKHKIIIAAPLSSGHVQKWIAPLIDKHEFHIVTLHPVKEKIEGVKIYSCPRLTKTRLDFIFYVFFLQYYICKVKPKILHAHFFSSYGLASSFCVTPYIKILSTWGTDVNGKPQSNFFIKKLCNFAINRFAWINAPAKHMKDKLIKLGAKPDVIDVFQYGVPIDEISGNVNKENDKLILTSIRNFDSIYHIEDLLCGYRKYCESHSDSRLYLFGKGTAKDEYKIKVLIEKLNFPLDSISFQGFKSRRELFEHLLKSRIVLSIPEMDGTPLSLLEAMFLCSLPIVSNIDANHEWLTSNSAVFIDSYSPDAICEAIMAAKKILASKTILDVLSKNKMMVEEKANYKINIDRLDSKYSELINLS